MANLAEEINAFFKSVSSDLSPITEENAFLKQECDVPSDYLVIVSDMEQRLAKVNRNKAGGPDNLPAWIFHDFSQVLAGPMASIANAAIRQGVHPSIWKLSNTVPVPKVNPPKSIQSDLRPIALTPIASKVLEYFPCMWMNNHIKDNVDSNQFGGIKRSSPTLALIKIVDYLAKLLPPKVSPVDFTVNIGSPANASTSASTARNVVLRPGKRFSLDKNAVVVPTLCPSESLSSRLTSIFAAIDFPVFLMDP